MEGEPRGITPPGLSSPSARWDQENMNPRQLQVPETGWCQCPPATLAGLLVCRRRALRPGQNLHLEGHLPLQCPGSCARSLGWHPAHRPSAAEEKAGRQGAWALSGQPLLAAGTVGEGAPQRQGRLGPRGMQGGQSRGRVCSEGSSEFSPDGHQHPGQSGAKALSGRMEPQAASLQEGRPTSGRQTATKPPQPAAPRPRRARRVPAPSAGRVDAQPSRAEGVRGGQERSRTGPRWLRGLLPTFAFEGGGLPRGRVVVPPGRPPRKTESP